MLTSQSTIAKNIFTENAAKKILKRDESIDQLKIDKIEKYLARIVEKVIIPERERSSIDIPTLLNSFSSMIDSIESSTEITSLLSAILTQFFEDDPWYSKIAATILIESLIKRQSNQRIKDDKTYESTYRNLFLNSIEEGVYAGIFSEQFFDFDLSELSNTLCIQRDLNFEYMGIFSLIKRYLVKINDSVIESPQGFFMRVAMGLSINEKDKNRCAKEFYQIMSTMRYIPSTPTLCNAGLIRPQLSSCFVNSVDDDLNSIFSIYTQNAKLAKWAGGIGTSWSKIRSSGSMIKSIQATSCGLIPYLKIADDIVGTITKSGIRRGGICAYIEVWHFEIEEFIELRKATGDARRRTHEMSTALWVCDLFFQRVKEGKEWTLFSPSEVPDLADCYGKQFVERYEKYEKMAEEKKIYLYKKIAADLLWKKILTRVFESGHPWITFKDPCNIRSPQDHCGMIYSSNLCTEIVLNTSTTETAVCNLGSINLANHCTAEKINWDAIKETVRTAVQMLDNIIDTNFYPIIEAEKTNKKHRPIGLGIAGLQDLLFMLAIPFESDEAEEINDALMEYISFCAIEKSADLAKERGKYESFEGSKWEKGIFPLDTIDLLEKERGSKVQVLRKSRLAWDGLKERVKEEGLRNSNLLAIAPTATISTITGVFPSIEPIYKNMYAKANTSGEFTVINRYLVKDLKRIGLWNKRMRDLIKFYDGSIQKITEIPEKIRMLYKTAFEISPFTLMDLASLRAKWIDQSQSLNIFFNSTSGKMLSELYEYAFNKGIKTTYYVKTLGSSQIEKATLDAKTYGFTQKRSKDDHFTEEKRCSVDSDGSCESCQ